MIAASGADRPPPVVILTGGWSGDATLVRLLTASGRTRVLGQPLSVPRRHSSRSLRRLLEPGSAILVRPADLWFHNTVEEDDFAAILRVSGAVVLSLARSDLRDAALSRAVCESPAEVVPAEPRHVSPADVIAGHRHAEQALGWISKLGVQLRFESDLATPAARGAAIARLAPLLGLGPWPAPWEERPPTHEHLWGAVSNPDELATGLADIEHALAEPR